jgi:hypothetical protein
MPIPQLKNEKWTKLDGQSAMQTADVTRSKVYNLEGLDAKIAQLQAELVELQRVRAAVVAAVETE